MVIVRVELSYPWPMAAEEQFVSFRLDLPSDAAPRFHDWVVERLAARQPFNVPDHRGDVWPFHPETVRAWCTVSLAPPA